MERRGVAAQGRSSPATRRSGTELRALRAHLAAGGLIAYATESCYGLGCDPRNARAVTRLLRLKGRPRAKGLILIAATFSQLAPYLAPVPAAVRGRFRDYWPGPSTLLLRASARCPRWLTGRHDKLAVRVTAHPGAARLCLDLGMALVSTSANRAGKRALKTAAACHRAFGGRVLVLEGRTGGRRRPSTIVDPESGRIFRA